MGANLVVTPGYNLEQHSVDPVQQWRCETGLAPKGVMELALAREALSEVLGDTYGTVHLRLLLRRRSARN
jgi:hypothetical protein